MQKLCANIHLLSINLLKLIATEMALVLRTILTIYEIKHLKIIAI